jgi:galactokinase
LEEILENKKLPALMAQLYGPEPRIVQGQLIRYRNLVEHFRDRFQNESELHLFSTPGRTEIGGNHTDHNHGRVLAASVNLDSIAVAARREEEIIRVYSEGYPDLFQVDLQHLDPKKDEEGTTTALIRGIAARMKELDYKIGGFDASITSQVLVGSGLSSSASIEVLVGTIFNAFFNQDTITPETIALIGQYAENHYFNKPCGLMDQMTCAVGGIVTIDFKDPQNPTVKQVPFDFSTLGIHLVVVDTGGHHADLTSDYAAVPEEMRTVANLFKKSVLREITWKQVLSHLPDLRKKVGDRAILRSYHFFKDNDRVSRQVEALERNDVHSFLKLVNESGISSFRWLQNMYTTQNPKEQGLSLALALTEEYLGQKGRGAWRVHGGGFAGTIQVFLPDEYLEGYVEQMVPIFGKQAIRVLNIRLLGTLHVNKILESL